MADFFKVFHIGENTVLVRCGLSIEPKETIKMGQIVNKESVVIHGSINVNGNVHLFDVVNFCCKHTIDALYESIDQKYCEKFLDEMSLQIKKSMNQVMFGIRDN